MASKNREKCSIRSIYTIIMDYFRRGNTHHYVSISPSIQIPHPNAIGVARVVIQAANITSRCLNPRPSVVMGVQGRSETKSTTQKPRTQSPTWFSESTYIIIYSLQENLELKVLNHHRFFRTTTIGRSLFPLVLLKDEPMRVGQESSISKKAYKNKGTLLFDIFYYPVLNPKAITRSSTSEMGVVTLRIQRAKDLQWGTYSKKARKLVAIASFSWSDNPFHITEPSYCSDVPVWNSVFDFACFEKASTVIVIKVAERYEGIKTIVYGHLTLALDELLVAQDESRKWWPLSGCQDGELRVSAEWKPIEIDTSGIHKAQ